MNNQVRTLQHIGTRDGLTRAQLSSALGMKPFEINPALHELERKELIVVMCGGYYITSAGEMVLEGMA
jgi:predicted transcriptional regulator